MSADRAAIVLAFTNSHPFFYALVTEYMLAVQRYRLVGSTEGLCAYDALVYRPKVGANEGVHS